MQRIANPFRAVRLRSAPPVFRRLAALVAPILLAGCTSYGEVQNQPQKDTQPAVGYSMAGFAKRQGSHSQELSLMLAFSGGGTRAAAMSCGVLLELRDTRVRIDGQDNRMLDVVGLISSVPGGSFTSAYCGL